MAFDASTGEIHDAYRALARVLHPDRSDSAAEPDDMAALNDAWFVLRDRERRAAYDRTLGPVERAAPVQTATNGSGSGATTVSAVDQRRTRSLRRLMVIAMVVFSVAAIALTIIAIIGAGNRP